MRKKIIIWLRKNIRNVQAKGVVIGLSGGLDSCVVTALAKGALGKDRVLGLLLPCHSQKQDLADARLFARKFGIKTKFIDLSEAYDNLIKILPAADQITKANLRPRLRMMVLYYFARKLGFLVCGTSNKSELLSGYFTKFGDGASDILPIGDLLKTQVRKLAGELKIPQAILEKPPSAGLWPGQTDEGELGVTYDELDNILARMEKGKKQLLVSSPVREQNSLTGSADSGLKSSAAFFNGVNRVKYLVRLSEHKRQMAAVCYTH